ncbi:glycosyltransferase [uncultured Microbacterium sp.]|uniref:glycosyltransferase n=1 Tax=uncultured Microbacterium sp. TaxID=191216 RepID=UPI0026359092|nr:glycosyltransferase [uncultured Microbacterium sp.]
MTEPTSSPSNVARSAVTPVLYLSGAPRLSTKATTESLGPRSHILGVISALRESGSLVRAFVVGDNVPQSFHGSGSEARMTASPVRLLAADLGRLTYRARSILRLWRLLRRASPAPAMAYERYALMQELGRVAQRKGATWVLEVNALLAIESTSDRRATSSRQVATFFERRTLRRADLIVAVTDQLKVAIHNLYHVPLDRILVVENGVDTTRHGDASAEPHGTPTIGFLGTLYPWQRVDRLLHAVHRSETQWNVRIAGEGPEYDALKQLVRQLDLDARVTFLGRVHPDEVPGFLTTVDICYAGHGSSEGVYFSPLKLWEYLAAGRPVLASRHDATERLNAQGYAVEVFDEADDDLDRALAVASESLPQLLETAVRDQERVRVAHSWTARIQPLLERVAERRRGPA